MFEYDGKKISMTRGDYAPIVCSLKDGEGEPYEMQAGDVITLTVREEPSKDSPVLLMISSTTNRIAIQHEDTKDLPIGTYSADIQLTMADGKRETFWPKLKDIKHTRERNFKNFEICPEVTTV